MTANQGDYWLAVVGQYIMRYTLVVKTHMGPETDVRHEEVHVDLTKVNQPIELSSSESCLNAGKVTPTP